MIIVKIAGGTGNQMFMYAYAKSLQKRGYKVLLDAETYFEYDQKNVSNLHIIRNDNLRCFNIDIPYISPSKTVFRWIVGGKRIEFVSNIASRLNWFHYYDWTNEKYFDKYLKEMMNLKDNAYVYGYFQSEKFFKKYREEIINTFTLDVDFDEEFMKKRNLEYPLIGIHFRRTDYKWQNTFDVTNMQYYIDAIEYLKNTIGKFDLCVFSDECDWVKRNFCLEDINVLYPSDYKKYKDYEEIVLMSRCDHNIIANSTFSWWGAWLNTNEDKIVIAPKKWLNYRKTLIVPQDWIQL